MNEPTKEIELPLLADHHHHPLLYSGLSQAVDLSSAQSWAEACDGIVSAGRNRDVVVAHGWRNNRFEIDPAELETLPPTLIFNFSLHDVVANQRGRDYLAARYGEEVKRMTDRVWFEANARKVWNWLAMLAASPEGLIRYFDQLVEQGVWSAEELLLVDSREITWFRETGLLHRTRLWAAPDVWETLSADLRNDVYGLKLFTDGAIGVRSAALSQSYRNDPDGPQNRGMLVYSNAALCQRLARCADANLPVAIHAIGDRAIEQTLDAITDVGADRFPEIRIEHAQWISRSQAERAKRLGVRLSMQPNFSTDSVEYADRLPPDFAARNNPFRMLIDQVGFEPGVDLILGSDGMPTGIEPALATSLSPPLASQRLTLDEFRAAYAAEVAQTIRCRLPGQKLNLA